MNSRELTDQWTADHPVGTPVRYWRGKRKGDGQLGRIRSRAWPLGDCENGTPVVLIEGCSGAVALAHVEVLTEEEWGELQACQAETDESRKGDQLASDGDALAEPVAHTEG